MKKAITFLAGIFLICFSATATPMLSENNITTYRYGERYIFVENGVEFSIFPDGQFDFVYLDRNRGSNVSFHIGSPNLSISFNSGYNYDRYVQYDIYGAVIQVESVPIYYDMYGRIIQAGDVHIYYDNRRIVRLGGLHIHYNRHGHFSHCTGFINSWNRHYVPRPWHRYYVRPSYAHCVVYDHPYRRYYDPIRYSYKHHRKYYKKRGRARHYNGRRDFYRPGSRTHYRDGRIALNKDYKPRNRRTGINRRENHNDRDSRVTGRSKHRSSVRNNQRRDENSSAEHSRSVRERKEDRSRATRATHTRRKASRGDDSRRNNARVTRRGDDNKPSVKRVSTHRKTRVAPKHREKVSGKRDRSGRRDHVKRSSVKRKATSHRKTVRRATPSSRKSTAGKGRRSTRGSRR